MSDIVNGWRPELHPRDQHGRFRNKWKLNSTAARLVDAIIGKFDPKMFMSDHDARDYMRGIGGHDYGKHVHPDVTHYIDGGWQQLNADMRKGHGELPQGMADAFKPSEADLILSRAVTPAAFGLPPNSDPNAVKEWTGRLVADAAPSATSIGTPLQSGPGTINMAILAPKGTDMIVPGNGSPDAILRPDQPIRITKVTGDAQNGIHVWAVLQPHNEKTRTRALGRKLTKAEIGPTDSTDVNLPEAQRVEATAPPTMEERIKALEAKMAAKANAPAGPAVGAPAAEAKKAVKRAPRKPREPQIADNPPPGEAPSQLVESTPEAAAAVLAVRGARLDSKPNERDVVAFRKKMDEMSLPAVREAARTLDVPIKGLRKKADIVDALVRNAYNKRAPIPAREPKPVKKAVKAAEAAVPAVTPAEPTTTPARDVVASVEKATGIAPERLRAVAEKLHIDVPPEKQTSPEILKHVVDTMAKNAVEAKAPSAEKPAHAFNTLAVGKTNANRVQNGEKILVRGDDTHGWGPTSTKTGATEITVTGKERSGAGYVITGHAADGKEIKTRPVVSHQTFFLGKEKPVSKAAEKAAPSVKAAEPAKPLTGAEARAARTAKMRARADAHGAAVRANPALIDQGIQGEARAKARHDAIAEVQSTVAQMQKDGASNTEIANAVDKLGAKHADLVHPEEANFIESKIGDIADSFRDDKPAIGKRKIALALKEETPRPTGGFGSPRGEAKVAEKAVTPEPVKPAEPAKPELSPAEQRAADLTARMDRLRKEKELKAEAVKQAPAQAEAAKPETATETVAHENAVVNAVRKIEAKPGDWVGLASLRKELDSQGISRENQDTAMKRLLEKVRGDHSGLGGAPPIRIIPVANTKALKPEDHAAAMRFGGEDVHAIQVSPGFTPSAPNKPETPKTPTATAPGANLEAGTAFKEAYKTEHAAGNLTSPHPGRQNVEYSKAYLLASRGRFDQAAKDLRADVEHNKGLVEDLRASNSAELPNAEHNLAAQQKLLAFIEKHNSGSTKKPVTLASLKHMANGTTKPPPANEYIDPATYFHTTVHDPTGRMARIERAHGIADIASKLLEHEHNHDDGPAFQQVLASQLRHWDNAPSTRESVAKWNALIDFRKEKITNKEELRAAVAKLAKEHNLSPVGKPGEVVAFDPHMHDRPPGVKNGDKVEILRPGFTLPKDPNEPHRALIKAQVIQSDVGTPEVHAPTPTAVNAAERKLPEGVVSAKQIMTDKTPDELRAAAEKVGIHVPDELHTSKEISDHVIKEMTRKAEAANRAANRSPVGKLLADPKMSDRRVLKAAGELSPAAHAKLSQEDRASLKDRLSRIANNASNPAEIRADARKAMDHLAGNESAKPVKAVKVAQPNVHHDYTPFLEKSGVADSKLSDAQRTTLQEIADRFNKGEAQDVLARDLRELNDPLLTKVAKGVESRDLMRPVQPSVPSATKQQFIQDEARKTAELLKHAATGDEARGLLANKSRDQLVAIAKEAGIVHPAGATKAAIIKEVVFHGVQKRLNSQSLARVATPAHTPGLPNVKPEHHAVTAPRTNMLGELTHQIKEAGSDQARHELLANKTSATLHALGKEHGIDFPSDAGKLHMAKSIIEKVTGKAPQVRAPHNVELMPRHDASVHGNSAIGELWDKIKKNDPSGESNALLNRLNEIGRDLSKLSNHDDVSAPQAAIDDLKKLRAEDFGSGPLERSRKLIDDTIARMDAPEVKVPDTSELGSTVPHFVHNYLEELAKIPAARRDTIPGMRSRGPSVFNEKLDLIKKLDSGNLNATESRRVLSQLAQRDLHESVEGSYQIWALNHKYFGGGGPGYKASRDWLKAIDEKVKREADAAANKAAAEVPKGKGAPRPYLDQYNHLDLKKLSTELGGNLQKFMDPTRNMMPATNAPMDQQFPFGYRIQNIVDDAANGNVSHNATIKELKEAIPIIERMMGHAEREIKRFENKPHMHEWQNMPKATVAQGPEVLDLLHKMVTHLEAQKLPSRKTRPTLPPTVSGQLAPVDEARFSQRSVRDILHHGGEAIPASFNHEPRDIPGVGRGLHAQIAAKAALSTNPHRPGLTTAESHALDVWTAGAPMRGLQESLRSGKVVHGTINPQTAKHIGEVNLDDLQKNLDSAIEKGSLQQDSVLWRGVLVKNADAKRFVPGAVFSEPGYTATAADRKAASDIISLWERDRKFQGQKPAYFKILAPKGTHGALGHMGLSEVLLGRGQRFQVVRVEPGGHGQPSTYVVQALLPDHPQGKNLIDDYNYMGIRDKITNFGPTRRGEPDLALGKILKDQGFDAKPKIVDSAELDRAVKEDGAIELHRAVAGFENKSAADLAEEFRSGALHPGTGAYGAGTYTTPESGVTANYGEKAGQLRMALPPSAKTIKYPDLQKLSERERQNTDQLMRQVDKQLAELTPGPSADRVRLLREQEMLKARRAVTFDLGRYAALLGYDAVIAPQGNRKGPKAGGAAEYVILNRSALLVQKAHDKSQG